MGRTPGKLLTALFAVVLIGHGWGAPSYPLDRLAPGQTGYGLTAGPGNVLERFPIEVLALQNDIGLGFPVVLIRASGDFIERSGGVAAGMSGSPVYLPFEGKDALLGAIGFIFPDSDHQLALVTPIEVMRRTAPSLGAEFGLQHFADLGEAAPVRTPLLISGLSERASTKLEALFTDSRVTPLPVQVGGSSAADDDAFELEPGSAVSVQLVRGDITIAAVGTVTLVEEGSFWAFGHPLLGQGQVSFALAPAYISHIVPSRVVPFKLADSGRRILGSVVEDRPYAVSGLLDETPDFIPVNLTLNSERRSVTKHFEITADERYYAPLLAAASLQIFDEITEKITPGTAELAWEIRLAGGDTLRLLEQITDAQDVAGRAAALAAEPLAILAENAFADPEVEHVELTIRYEETQRVAEIIEVVAENETLNPGEVLTVHVRLQPYRDEPEVKTVRVPIPEAAEGLFDVMFRGGLETGEPVEGDDPILSFAELLVALREHVQSSELVVEAFVDGELQRLERLPLAYLVRGSKTLTVTVGEVEAPAEEPPPEPPEDEVPESPPPSPELPPPFQDPPLMHESR